MPLEECGILAAGDIELVDIGGPSLSGSSLWCVDRLGGFNAGSVVLLGFQLAQRLACHGAGHYLG